MKIRESASQFTVYVFSVDIDGGAGLKIALGQAGYDAFFFENRDTLMSRLIEKPPHVLVFPTASLTATLGDFVEQVLKVNAEIRFVVIAKPAQSETLAAYNDYGVEDVLTDETEGLIQRTVFAVDRVCEKLYLTYQNEQLLARLHDETEKVARATSEAKSAVEQAARQGPPVDERIKEYRSAESKEDLIARFMRVGGRTPWIFLKYLPMVRSLVVTHSSAFEEERIQGVGCQLKPEEARDFGTQISLGVVPPSLDVLLRQAFQFKESRLLPLFVQSSLEGVIAAPADLSISDRERLHDEFALLALSYANFCLERRVDTLEVTDPVTEIGNRKFYLQRLNEEWQRARRIRQPLSVLKLALDDFYELEQTLGEATRDLLLKNLAQMIQKTSRANDVAARTGQNEFAVILPHSDRQGSMVRAERLRRIVESSQMIDNGLKVSISVGISEYPTLCANVESLDESSSKALAHIRERGGNKLCLFKAPADHRPEFEVIGQGG